MSCIELAAIGIKVILVVVSTIIGGVGTTDLMSSMYFVGLLFVIASAMLMESKDKITSWIVGAPGAEHHPMLQLPV